jgi:hypothetical protein
VCAERGLARRIADRREEFVIVRCDIVFSFGWTLYRTMPYTHAHACLYGESLNNHTRATHANGGSHRSLALCVHANTPLYRD